MLVRLIQVIHWFLLVLSIMILSLGIIKSNTFFDDLIEIMFFIDTYGLSIWGGIILDCTIIMPFIRYIIFGRFGWFPWTPFRKE